MSRISRPWPAAVLVGLMALPALGLQEDPKAHEPGRSRPLGDFLAELQGLGLRLVYSDALVGERRLSSHREALWGERPPAALELEDLLLEAGLDLRAVATSDGEILLVTRKAASVVLRVRNERGAPLRGVVARGPGGEALATSDARGRIDLDRPGRSLSLFRAGYRPVLLPAEAVAVDRFYEVSMAALPQRTDTIEVSSTTRSADPSSVSRGALETAITPASDPIRAASRALGWQDSEAGVRPSSNVGNDTPVSADGFELYRPYHLEEFGRPLSLLDPNVVTSASRRSERVTGATRSLDLTTGPTSTTPRLAVEVGPLLLAASGSGSFGEDTSEISSAGRWMLSGRAGLLERLAELAEFSERPRFWDVFGHLDRGLSSALHVTLKTLLSEDQLELDGASASRSVGAVSDYRSTYRSLYVWTLLERAISSDVFLDAVAGFGNRDVRRRAESSLEPTGSYKIGERSGLDTFQLRSEVGWLLGPHKGSAGIEMRQLKSSFDYRSTLELPREWRALRSGPVEGEVDFADRPKDERIALFANHHLLRSTRIDLALGARYEQGSLRPGDARWTPRLRLGFDLEEAGLVRLDWARFADSALVHEIQVADGRRTLEPPEVGQHAGVEWSRSTAASQTSLSAHWRHAEEVRPRFFNVLDPFSFVPEAEPDRRLLAPSGRRSSGLAARGQRRLGGHWSAEAGLFLDRDRLLWSELETPAPEERSVRFDLGLHWRPERRWSIDLAWRWTDGAPTTPLLTLGPEEPPVFGALFSERLPPVHQLDLRLAYLRSMARGTLRLSLELLNAYDRRNPRGFDLRPGETGFFLEPAFQPGLLPSFTIRWTL